MSAGGRPPRRWKWTQRPDFVHPEHPEWDLIQWDLEDELVKGPRMISLPVFEEGPNVAGDWRFMKSKQAPGLQHLPAIVVLFRIVSEPSEDRPGVIEGWEAWSDDDLYEVLLRRVRRRPVF